MQLNERALKFKQSPEQLQNALQEAMSAHNAEMAKVQLDIETQYANTNALNFERTALFENSPGLEEYIDSFTTDNEIAKKFIVKFLVQMDLQKCCDLQTIWGIMRCFDPEHPQWVLSMIKLCLDAGLVNLTESGKFLVKYSASEENQIKMRQFIYPMPSIVPMRKLRHNYDSGYLSLKTGSVILNQPKLAEGRDCCLDVLNIFQSQTYKIDMDVANHIAADWDFVASQKSTESYETYKQRIRNFNQYKDQTYAILQRLNGLPLHMMAKYDFRGRLYDIGYHIHVQGKEWNKAILSFWNGQLVTDEVHKAQGAKFTQFSAMDYLRIDIAGSYGHDKWTWDKRIEWTREHEAKGDLLSKELLDSAESRPLYYAGVKALMDAKAGKPVYYAINLDGTASGTQILGAILGDEKCMMMSNVLPVADAVGKAIRADTYSIVHKTVCRIVGNAEMYTYFDPDLNKVGDKLMPITRTHSKFCVMRSFYGSEKIIKDVYGEDTPAAHAFEQAMSLHAPLAWWLNKALLQAWDPEATEYSWTMPDGFDVWFPVEDTRTVDLMWGDTPVTLEYVAEGVTKEKGRALSANMVHSLDSLICREVLRRCNYNPAQVKYVLGVLSGAITKGNTSPEQKALCQRLVALAKASGFLSARILGAITPDTLPMLQGLEKDVQALIESLPSEPFEVMTIHDCFRVLPRYGNDVRFQYTKLLSELNHSDVGLFLTAQITNAFTFPAHKNVSDEILEAEYALS